MLQTEKKARKKLEKIGKEKMKEKGKKDFRGKRELPCFYEKS